MVGWASARPSSSTLVRAASVAGLSAEVNTPIAVGTEGRAEIVEANARIGWSSVAERPMDPRGWRPSLAGGLGGGAAVVWGGNLAVNRVALAPAAHVWVGVGVAAWRRAQVTFGLRANLVRLDLVAAGNDGAGGDPHVAESWMRAELAFCPVLVGDDRAEK